MNYNLLDEPWIRVMDDACTVSEVSIKEALLNAHRYSALAGETPAQDVSVLRLLVAIIHTVFYRMDEEGNPAMLKTADDALDRWEAIWGNASFPEKPVQKYLAEWEGRFDLLDPEKPFYQVPEALIPAELRKTPRTAAKLNGAILESDNKARIFSGRTQETKQALSFSEAARWLLFLNAFDDCSVAPKYRKGIGTGWLGKLGIVYVLGNNLFETIMLNNAFLNWNRELYAEPRPIWESAVRAEDRSTIPVPDNLPELFTLQSRRTYLVKGEGCITGYYTYGGDVISNQDAFCEPMTLWQRKKDGSGYVPKHHDPARRLWRDFSSVVMKYQDTIPPGITVWLSELQQQQIMKADRIICYSVVSVTYGSQNCGVDDDFSDSLSFHSNLLSEVGGVWQIKIKDQVDFVDRVANALGTLAGNLAIAAGKREIKNGRPLPAAGFRAAENTKSQYYHRIDEAFRKWLLQPQAGQSAEVRDELCALWRDEAIRIARIVAKEEVDQAGPAAMLGRWVETERDGQKEKRHYSAAEAVNRFNSRLRSLLEGGT